MPESAASAPYWALSSFNFCSNSFHKHHQKSSAGNNGPLFNCRFTLIPPSGIVWSFLNILDNIISLACAISALPLRSRSQWSVNKHTHRCNFLFLFSDRTHVHTDQNKHRNCGHTHTHTREAPNGNNNKWFPLGWVINWSWLIYFFFSSSPSPDNNKGWVIEKIWQCVCTGRLSVKGNILWYFLWWLLEFKFGFQFFIFYE